MICYGSGRGSYAREAVCAGTRRFCCDPFVSLYTTARAEMPVRTCASSCEETMRSNVYFFYSAAQSFQEMLMFLARVIL